MITWRREAPGDRAAVARIVTAAFDQDAETKIVEAIRGTSSEVLSLVAEEDGVLAAHALFSIVTLDDPRRACALGPVAVDPPRQSKRIGDALIRAGIAELRLEGWQLLFVLGNPKYYARFGFVPAAPYGWHFGSHELDRAFQVIVLDGSEMGSGGERWIEYHPAFG
jgi:putative acetyltransferase